MPLFGPPNVEKLKARRDIAGLVKALAYKKDWNVRKAAAGALAKIGDARAVESLIAALKDEAYYVRQTAAEALGKIGWKPEKSEAGALYLIARGKWDQCVKIGAPAVEPLIAALKDGDLDVRLGATAALAKIGAPAVEPLIAALKDGDLDVRLGATAALAKIGAPAVEPLIAALKDGDWNVRQAAAGALGEIGAPAVEPLIAALKDGDWWVRGAAAKALRKIGWKPDKSEAGAHYLIAQGKWDECVKIGAPAVEPLIAAFKDGDLDVRRAAAGALGAIGDARAVEPLIAALKDGDFDVRWAAARALGEIGDARAVEPLIAALKDEVSHRRWAAAEALGKIGWKPDKSEAGAHYLIAQRKWDECVKIGAPAVEPLIAALKDRGSGVRKAAAEALVRLCREGGLGAAQRQLILGQRNAISEPHCDSFTCNFHADGGIGVPFPL
jgi:HEAT repeat protein